MNPLASTSAQRTIFEPSAVLPEDDRTPSSVRVVTMISDMTWSGAVHMEPGILMFTGAVGSAHMHSHAAVQIMIVDDGGDVTVTDGGDGHSEVVRSVVIPSGGAVHALSASEGARGGRAIYVDSTTGDGPAHQAACIRARWCGRLVGPWADRSSDDGPWR